MKNGFCGHADGGVVLTDYDGGEGRELSALQRGAALLLGFATLCLVWTALYLSFTPVGADVIRGVQGRYYLPVTMMGLLAVRTIALRNCLPRRIDLTVVTALSVFLLLCAMHTGVICNTF